MESLRQQSLEVLEPVLSLLNSGGLIESAEVPEERGHCCMRLGCAGRNHEGHKMS